MAAADRRLKLGPVRVPDPRVAITLAVAALVVMLAVAPARAADPVIAAAGDIACNRLPANPNNCQQQATSNLIFGQPLAAVLALGDVQYERGKLADYQKFYDPTWGRFKSITRPAIGNHEYYTQGASGYFEYFGAIAAPPHGWYSYDIGSWHLIALNSNCDLAGGCGTGSPQGRWLRSDLAHNASKRCTLAYWHQPHFSSGALGDDDAGRNSTLGLWQLLYNAGADVVLGGHDHDYERFGLQDPDGDANAAFGIREFVVGTGGKSQGQFGPLSTNSEVRNTGTYGVLEMTLHPASYDWRFVPVAGKKTFTDSGTQLCHGSPRQPLIKLRHPGNRLSRGGSLSVSAVCQATCTARAQVTVGTGRRKVRSRRLSRLLQPLTTTELRLKFSGSALRALRARLRHARGLRATVKVSARAANGSHRTATTRLRLRP